MFRAGTSSRLKRLGLFRSCRREASPKTQGLSEDASHHAREHKTPQRGRRTVSIDRFPKIHGSGIPDSSPFHKKYVAHPQKSFRIDPFSKRGRRVAGREALRKVSEKRQRPESIDRHLKINGFGIPGSLPFPKKYVVRPQKKFSDRPLFQKGSPGCRAGSPAKYKKQGAGAEKKTMKSTLSNFLGVLFTVFQKNFFIFAKAFFSSRET